MIFGLCSVIIVGGVRIFVRFLYSEYRRMDGDHNRIIIFGAGAAGVKLAELCKLDVNYKAVAFIDEDASMWGRDIGGLLVYPPEEIQLLLSRFDVSTIIFAIPSANETSGLRIVIMLSISVDVVNVYPEAPVYPFNNREFAIDELLGRAESKKSLCRKYNEKMSTICWRRLVRAGDNQFSSERLQFCL